MILKPSKVESKNFGGIFDLEVKEEEIKVLENSTTAEGFWNDQEAAQGTLKKIRELKSWVESFEEVHQGGHDLNDMFVMAQEEKDEETKEDVMAELPELEGKVKELEVKKMLDGPDDSRTAIVTIHPGSGGTESADWALMLFRMYTRFFDKRGWKYNVLDMQDAEEAGIKSVTIEVVADYAFGYLRSEIGVHRLVRISPFDSNARRHTSFAACYVYPVVEDVEIDIAVKDIKVDTYRASGAGGQHINKTDSAVRMTHIPTGIVVTCQNERSQIKNRDQAMKVLKAAVYQKLKEEEEARRNEGLAEKHKIEWGSQIRNYVLHPYNLVKDVRTSYETSDTSGVLDGNLQPFIEHFLMSSGEA